MPERSKVGLSADVGKTVEAVQAQTLKIQKQN